MLKAMQKDNIVIIKKDGKEIGEFKASVQREKTFITSSTIIIEPGDIIKRVLSNGAEEFYEVINPQFYEDFHSIKAHYQIEHRKLGIEEKEKFLKVEITNPDAIAPELKEIASYLMNLTTNQKEMLKLLANKNEILDEMLFLKNDEIVLMKMNFEKLKKKDEFKSLPWDTFNSVISIASTLAALKM